MSDLTMGEQMKMAKEEDKETGDETVKGMILAAGPAYLSNEAKREAIEKIMRV